MYGYRVEFDPNSREPNHVTHGGDSMHVGQSQVESFLKGVEKLLNGTDGQLQVQMSESKPVTVEEPSTISEYMFERPEIVAPKNVTKTFNYKDLRTTLNSLLEKIIALSKLQTDETMNELTMQRIETIKTQLKRTHDDMAAKIRKNIEAMRTAAKNRLMMKIFGWIMAVVLVVAAIFTGGAAIAGAIGAAAGAAAAAAAGTATALTASQIAQVVSLCVSAALALTMQILDETGVMEKWQKQLTEKFRKQGLKNAELRASLAIQLPFLIAMLGTGVYGGAAIGNAISTVFKLADATMKIVSTATTIGNTVVGLAVGAQQGLNIAAQYKAAMAGADVEEVRAIVQLVRQMLDEAQEELQEVLEKIEDLLSRLFDIIASALDAQKEIAERIGRMA